ncbi:hypothetical protein CYMTET_6772 [Cymbomonas tetramitiformis]|uniref:Uncharacterized protein n=1 Tax=Cymbomonas tetramitiformis TaxID=36881 RepID=A0AAE0LI48_9CHLO|nr:hypothetical protein CYMTET_6772 [Cymbomonas tetramitiformis]
MAVLLSRVDLPRLRDWTNLALTCITLSRADNQRARAVDTPEDIHFVIPGDDKDIPDRLTSSSAADIAWAAVFPAPQSQSPPPVVEGSSPGPLTKTSSASVLPRILSSQELSLQLNIELPEMDFQDRRSSASSAGLAGATPGLSDI